MKKLLCLVLVAAFLVLSGCANQQPMKAYWDGDTFIVENVFVDKEYHSSGSASSTMPERALEELENRFKNFCTNEDSGMIVFAKKGQSVSYVKNYYGMTLTDITITKVLWSSDASLNGIRNIKIAERYFYCENDDGELILCFDTIDPYIILSNDADYYVLYLTHMYYPWENPYNGSWYCVAGFKVSGSTRDAVSKGIDPIEAGGIGIGIYSHLYKEVFEKYVD